MGRLFSWSKLFKPVINREKCGKLSTKRTQKQVKECMLLDQLLWLQKKKKILSQPLEKIDQNWYCKVIKGAKYSRIGDCFIDPNLGIKCVRIDRPDMNKSEPLFQQSYKGKIIIKKQQYITKMQPKIEKEPSFCNMTSKIISPSSSIDGTCTESSENGSVLSASEIVRQSQRFLPKLEVSPVLYSNPMSILQSSGDNIDVLNYDFSFTSPAIKS